MASELTMDEQEMVKCFMEELGKLQAEIDPNNIPVQWNTAVKFLMARKFDIRRAVDLYRSHEMMRKKEMISIVDPLEEGFHRELCTEKLTILSGRDSNGAAIALFTARLHHPEQTTNQDVLKALIFQLDTVMESLEAQRNGLVFIYDMTNSKYSNFDYDLSTRILNMLKGSYPARLKKVLIVTAPMWFRAPFKILRLFVKEKLRDRVYTVNIQQLLNHIPSASLPRRLGGTADVDHRAWIARCLKTLWNKSTVVSDDCDERIAAYVSGIVPLTVTTPEMSTGRPSFSSYSPNDGVWDTEPLSAALGADYAGLEWDASVTGDQPVSPYTGLSRKRGVEQSPVLAADNTAESMPAVHNLHLTAPPPAKKRQPSDEGSIHGPDNNGLTIQELVQYCRIKGQRGLMKEYKEIKDEVPAGTFEISKSRPNMLKNRYTDVLCLDHSRVVLSSIDGDPSSSYINANFVDGYRQKNAFISTQGPLPKTFADFWRMVWEQDVLVVVMTTRTVERGRIKCGQYWPADEESVEQYGTFAVVNIGVEVQDDYCISNLTLQNLDSLETREITHMQFLGWPDYGVPHSAASFLDFMFLVREKQTKRVQEFNQQRVSRGLAPVGIPPIVIHCSAGIGRTGTFITMDINTRKLSDTGIVNIAKTVRLVRSQRAFSIQMPDQYVFCHVALIEHAMRQGLLSTPADGEPGPLDGFEDDTSSNSD